jgi:hypothetical protein
MCGCVRVYVCVNMYEHASMYVRVCVRLCVRERERVYVCRCVFTLAHACCLCLISVFMCENTFVPTHPENSNPGVIHSPTTVTLSCSAWDSSATCAWCQRGCWMLPRRSRRSGPTHTVCVCM